MLTDLSVFSGKKVLITGNTGFKGTWLSLWLNALGAEVYGFSDGFLDRSMYHQVEASSCLKHQFIGDITNYTCFSDCISTVKPNFIFHLAAQAIVSESYSDPLKTIHVNAYGTAVILEALRHQSHFISVIIVTSDKCYENYEWCWGYRETDQLGGADIYSSSKASAEIIFSSYCRSFFNSLPHIRLATVRAGNVVGGGDWAVNRVVPDAFRAWSKNMPILLRSPGSTRPWQHVLEPLGGYLLLAKRLLEDPKVNMESFNFGPSALNAIPVSDFVSALSDCSNGYGYRTDANSTHFKEARLLSLNTDKALNLINWTPTLQLERLYTYISIWYQSSLTDTTTALRQLTIDQINDFVAASRS
jgi:CDP-glucose 4,6-dehydratase